MRRTVPAPTRTDHAFHHRSRLRGVLAAVGVGVMLAITATPAAADVTRSANGPSIPDQGDPARPVDGLFIPAYAGDSPLDLAELWSPRQGPELDVLDQRPLQAFVERVRQLAHERQALERLAAERAERRAALVLQAREQAERDAREQAERDAREQAERDAREQAERDAREQAERERAASARSHWDRLAECESGNWIDGGASFEVDSARWNWAAPGMKLPPWGTSIHHGGLQFHPQTWDEFKPEGYPRYAYEATREQQIEVGTRVQAVQGWGAWPVCSRKVGLR